MSVHTQITKDLKQDEGWRPSAYQDHLGFWTIGYGFLIDERRNGRLPRPVAEFWLEHEISQCMMQLGSSLDYFDDAPDGIRRALGNMAYQLGVSGVLGFRKTLALIEAGKYQQAALEALNSRWARQTPNRAARVAEWIRAAQQNQPVAG